MNLPYKSHLAMHYAHFKQTDPRVLKAILQAFPFATISTNAMEIPAVAHAPLTFREDNANGMVEFHLAKANSIITHLQNGTKLTIIINGPSAHISPSWYTARFSGNNPDRSNAAPTYNYINANLFGSVQMLDDIELTAQIKELVAANEPADGWKLEEIDHDIFNKWRNMIIGFRMPIESFDLTAKLSQEQNPVDKPGIIEGLRQRGKNSDIAMARIIERFDGTPESLIRALQTA